MDDLLDRAPCGFVSFTDDGHIVLANATLLDRLGLQRDEVMGRHVESLFSVGGRIFFQTHFFPLVRLHGHAEEVFLLLRARSGEDVGAMCNAVRRERDGQAVTDCVLVEVRERRKYEDALLQARRTAEEATRASEEANRLLETQAIELELQHEQLQEQAIALEEQTNVLAAVNHALEDRTLDLERQRLTAEEANRAKSSFLAVMSHELRTPLNAIGGYAELIEMGIHGPTTQPQREALDRILRSQRHLLRLINEVLNLSRIEAGRVEYAIEPVAIATLVAAVLPMVEPQMAGRSLQCTIRVPPALAALADREKVQQILLNLLTNATKFTAPGGRIRIAADYDGCVAGLVALRVTDSGIGIPPAMRDRVFEPFVQVDESHTRTNEGTGLGLAISRDLARGMGGELSLVSEVGVGSTFTLVLPAAPVNANEVVTERDAPARGVASR